MSICLSCWDEAQKRALGNPNMSQTEHYHAILGEHNSGGVLCDRQGHIFPQHLTAHLDMDGKCSICRQWPADCDCDD